MEKNRKRKRKRKTPTLELNRNRKPLYGDESYKIPTFQTFNPTPDILSFDWVPSIKSSNFLRKNVCALRKNACALQISA